MSKPRLYNAPMLVEKDQTSDKIYDICSRLLLDRIVFVTGVIDDNMANSVCAQILFLQAQDPKKRIDIYINSPGGMVTSGLAIYDTMKLSTCPIATVCMGQAASMGAFLLAGGTKGLRHSLPHASIMVHQPSGGAEGKISDIEISYKESQRLKDMLNQILADNCGKSPADMAKILDRDYFMTPDEAKDMGLIDKIL